MRNTYEHGKGPWETFLPSALPILPKSEKSVRNGLVLVPLPNLEVVLPAEVVDAYQFLRSAVSPEQEVLKEAFRLVI